MVLRVVLRRREVVRPAVEPDERPEVDRPADPPRAPERLVPERPDVDDRVPRPLVPLPLVPRPLVPRPLVPRPLVPRPVAPLRPRLAVVVLRPADDP